MNPLINIALMKKLAEDAALKAANTPVVHGKDGKDGKDGKRGPKGEKGQDGRGIKSVKVSDDSRLIITYTDGEIVSAGKVQVNVENHYQSALPVGHFAIFDAEFNDNNELVLICNNGKRINAGAPVTAATVPKYTDYIMGVSEEPVRLLSDASGDVWSYTYGATTLYRFIPAGNPYGEGFYRDFDGSVVSNLVLARAIQI